MATVTRRLAALLGASGAGLTDSATASKITTDSINDDAVNAAKIAANAVGTSEVADNVLTATDLAANSVGESELSVDYTAQSVPHIVPGVLYPAVDGKGIDGTTTITSFGTDVAISGFPTLKYYYTNIKGSKPIKDPRIGAHFGSQRHKFKSLQQLEQETATHGSEVLSIDGREWCRRSSGGGTQNDSNGSNITFSLGFLEVTGYLSDFNLIMSTHTVERGFKAKIDGTDLNSGNEITTWETSASTPLGSRYVDSGSLANVANTTTLGIHTIRIEPNQHSDNMRMFGIELIAQDTSNRNNIQIPSQNVVSFGKKFTVSGTPHYDPFTTMSYGGSGTTLSNLQSLIDTDTSLGMDAWKAGGSNFHRPWNGGRVVKWVDSTGTIKTSVNMMPPNAQNIETTASNPVSNTEVEAGTNGETINFNTSAIDHSQAEVAKTFLTREFGNGNANGGSSGNYKDASMLPVNSVNDIAYVMDDGLTSLAGHDVKIGHAEGQELYPDDINDFYFITFIGTGITLKSGFYPTTGPTHATIAQNLPYGTHIIKVLRTSTDSEKDPTIFIDGATLTDVDLNNYGDIYEITFHQPKKPPIPEDACVLADYMLMADFVPQTSREVDKISKGIRRVNSSRDVFYDGTTASFGQASTFAVTEQFGFDSAIINGTPTFQLPYFGTGNILHFRGNSSDRATQITYSINGNAVTDANFSGISRLSASSNGITFDTDGTYGQNVGSQVHNFAGVKGGISLGSNIIKNTTTESSKYLGIDGIDVATPIHTSHHYQAFETPFLHELVGGDRNMEQTNLVVSPDGKTWDQITRDTSYMGGGGVRCDIASSDNTHGFLVFTEWRGEVDKYYDGSSTQSFTAAEPFYTKNFAIAYDRLICLKDGKYHIYFQTHTDNAMNGNAWGAISKNDKALLLAYLYDTNYPQVPMSSVVNLVRGDFIQIKSVGKGDLQGQSVLNITQV